MQPTYSYFASILGQGQSERNLEIGIVSAFVRRLGSEALREGLAKN